MDDLTPDELNELCAIAEARYVALAEAVAWLAQPGEKGGAAGVV